MKSAVHLDGTLNVVTDTDRGWSVELAVPWSALGELARRTSPPADGDQWRVNFSRVQWALEVANGAYRKVPKRPENNWVWSPQHVVNMHRPETWGYVQFSTARPGSATFRPDASLPARRWLHEVYYAQIAFRQKNKRWATSFEELRITLPAGWFTDGRQPPYCRDPVGSVRRAAGLKQGRAGAGTSARIRSWSRNGLRRAGFKTEGGIRL